MNYSCRDHNLNLYEDTGIAPGQEWMRIQKKQQEQILIWALDLIEGRGSKLYRRGIKILLSKNPSELCTLSPETRQRLENVLEYEEL
jgi:hypothetical protein